MATIHLRHKLDTKNSHVRYIAKLIFEYVWWFKHVYACSMFKITGKSFREWTAASPTFIPSASKAVQLLLASRWEWLRWVGWGYTAEAQAGLPFRSVLICFHCEVEIKQKVLVQKIFKGRCFGSWSKFADQGTYYGVWWVVINQLISTWANLCFLRKDFVFVWCCFRLLHRTLLASSQAHYDITARVNGLLWTRWSWYSSPLLCYQNCRFY